MRVPNISCGHCLSTIEREVGRLEGVVSVKAEVDGKTVTVEWNQPLASWDAIRSVLEEISYPPAA